MGPGNPSIPKEIAYQIQVFSATVKAQLGFLEPLGYQPPLISMPPSKVLPYWTEIEFQNSTARRKVSLGLVPSNPKNKRASGSLSLSLSRLPDVDVHDMLAFDLFLAKHRPDIDQRSLDIRSYEGPFEERLDKVLGLYASLLQSEAKDILSGERWEEGFYHPWV